jgi:hypothetical protein
MAAMRRSILPGSLAIVTLIAGGALLSGCSPSAPTTQPTSLSDRQARALQDPYGYTPDPRNSDMTVSGHGEFDKEGFNRDKDFVLNP